MGLDGSAVPQVAAMACGGGGGGGRGRGKAVGAVIGTWWKGGACEDEEEVEEGSGWRWRGEQ